MLRTLFWVCYLFLYMILRLPMRWKAVRLGKKGRVEEQRAYVNKTVKTWATRLLRHTRLELVVQGAEHLPPEGETVMFVANHQSFIDIPVLMAGLNEPCALMAKRSLGKVPFLSAWMTLLDCVYVQREDARAAMTAMRECENLLQNGRSVIICPEGTRSKSDEMGEFKPGAVRMAAKAGVRIVPLAIDGSWRALEGSGYRLKKCTIRLVVLPAVETGGLSKDEQKVLNKELENRIRAAKDDRG